MDHFVAVAEKQKISCAAVRLGIAQPPVCTENLNPGVVMMKSAEYRVPRRCRCGRLVPDAHGAQSACDDGTVDAIPIADEIFWGIIPRKRVGHLKRHPLCCRVCCDVDPDQVSAVGANGKIFLKATGDVT